MVQPYGRGHRALEIAAIAFAFGSLGWIAFRVACAAGGAGDWVRIALAAGAGYLVSDFLSGVVHWAGDTLGDESTPVLGANFVRPFRYHHVDPEDITRHDFVETNGNNCILATPVLAAVLFLLPHTTTWLFHVCAAIASTALFALWTNQFHKWAHMQSPPAWVRALQRCGLILSPAHHAVHHAAPHDKHYCVTAGWMNRLLDATGFFRRCEALLMHVDPRLLRPDREDRLEPGRAAGVDPDALSTRATGAGTRPGSSP